jgi:Ca2+-transporting ATPase
VNVVWLELIMHPVSVLVFEGRDSGEDVMGRPPHKPNRPIPSLGAAARSAMCGALLATGACAAYVWYLPNGEACARGVAIVAAVIGSILLVFVELAGERRWWKTRLPRDARFWTVCPAATPFLFSNVPLFAKLFGLAGLSWKRWRCSARRQTYFAYGQFRFGHCF